MKEILNSKYVITWIEIEATKGIVTQHDRKIFGDILLMPYKSAKYHKHFRDRKSAIEWLKSFNKKLDKKYRCRLCSDAQFGMMRDGEIPFTSKQRNEVYYIG